jgi:glycerol-3-phosphate acyltransferase PlsY
MGGPLVLVLSALVGYLLGTFPTGALVAKSGGVDLTRVGSGSTGATNVLRSLGPRPAFLVFLGDFGKGALAVVFARAVLGGDAWAQVVAATAAVVGHTYSPWIGWRGGRGVLTGVGGLAMLWPQAALFGSLCGLLAIALTRYVSLGSLVATVTAALAMVALVMSAGQSPAYLIYALVVPLFIVVAHRGNIARLLQGTERKLGEKA